jgi:RNA-binding protein
VPLTLAVFLRGEKLRRIGRALHLSTNKNIILKAENLPNIGDEVVDESFNSVGNVFDIIGSINSPYIVVKPHVKETRNLINHILYFAPSKTKMKKKKEER